MARRVPGTRQNDDCFTRKRGKYCSTGTHAAVAWINLDASLAKNRQEKSKVDWDDVEAKAKREAMWLLEYRKHQVRCRAFLSLSLYYCCIY